MDMNTDWIGQVSSREALRFAYVDEQGWDASCGYSALASLLRRYRNVPVTEQELLAASASRGDTVVKVSLAKLVSLVRERNLQARPWKLDYEALAPLLADAAPLLVHYDRPEGHFALLLAIGPAGIVTGDPARGAELLTKSQFLARWSGVAVEIRDPQDPLAGQLAVEKAVKSVVARASLTERALSKPPSKR